MQDSSVPIKYLAVSSSTANPSAMKDKRRRDGQNEGKKEKAISKLAEVYKHLSSFALHDKRNTRQPKENKHEGKCISPVRFHSLALCIYIMPIVTEKEQRKFKQWA